MTGALSRYRICDFTGQLAGAGATKWIAAFGADVIRIEDPVMRGRWDILRAMPPFVDERRGEDFGGGFNNHNTDKKGITLNLRTEKGKEILRELVRVSDVVSENFAAGVLDKWGFGYEALKEMRPDVIYVSNCGFGHVGPYGQYKTWGPIVQAICGLTFTSGLPDEEPAGWGYSYMDHTGAMYMAIAILMALMHRERTGEGQWVDLACTEVGLTLHGPALLDWTINHRPTRRPGMPNGNRSLGSEMAPHGIFRCSGDDEWVAIVCRDEGDWCAFTGLVNEPWTQEAAFADIGARKANEDALEAHVTAWTRTRGKFDVQRALLDAGIPAAAVQKPGERIDQDPDTEGFDLWPSVVHSKMGEIRVDGLPVHLSKTDWRIERGGPCLGEHTEQVLTGLLGMSSGEVAALREEGVV
ncbi:MAG: CoA transferase [Pseudomonadales bacterium]|nr:CoA transferase [Pseudomonadales bacterium]MDP6472445.1 CoA transferase [Pseudomonadales bacterium]MDP6828744.1 CoA transferase [Pseudomonadales bacterium]MDP6971459.1 CoA transferase [Pseudomonadales bacterium]